MKTTPNDRRFLGLLLTAVIVTFLMMAVGNAIRVVDGAQACPDWPTCFGRWAPLPSAVLTEPLGLQYAHRALAVLSVVLAGLSAWWSFRKWRGNQRLAPVSITFSLAFIIMLVEAILGSKLVIGGVSPLYSGIHLVAALVSLGLAAAGAAAAFYIRARKPTSRPAYRSHFFRLSLGGLAAVFVLLISGTLVSSLRALGSCPGWPLCSGGLPGTTLGWLALTHRLVVLVTGVILTVQFITAWKGQRSQVATLTAATGSFILLLGQSLIGTVISSRGFPADLVGLHAAASAGLWAIQVVLAVSTGLTARAPEEEKAEAAEPLPVGRRIKDFVILSKPIIVLLLLVTTYAGMVVGGKSVPSAGLTFWTLLGGALAAGGASALNQYIDRDTDRAMQRTSRRPLPDGRLKPAEGLAYGLGACLSSFYLLAVYVNLLSALLSLAGMIYYVLIYSVWLKRLTVQNIVIGGGAGAIPPLVGWAAATGALNIPSLFLFAIIFLWTPPHFWALALVRVKDYARGQVPMLPVIRGEAETRRQIFIYTLELVGLTLLMPVLKIAGTIYLISAVVLGIWLIHAAWRVLKTGGNKTAWNMYRYSSMYLAFLMFAMVLDVLLAV